MLPVCAQCCVEYHCLKNEVLVALGSRGIFDADLYRCPTCRAELIVGFGSAPIMKECDVLPGTHVYRVST